MGQWLRLTQDEGKALYESFTDSFLNPFAADEMFQTMKATGRSQFSLEEIHSFVEQASGRAAEEAYKAYQDALKDEAQRNATVETGTVYDDLPSQEPTWNARNDPARAITLAGVSPSQSDSAKNSRTVATQNSVTVRTSFSNR